MWLNTNDLILIGLLYAVVIASIAAFICCGRRRAPWRDDERDN